jgi:hypothetical protein
MAGAPAPQPNDVVRLQGRGTVYRNGQRLGETGYDLMIVPPKHTRPVFSPGTPPTDRPDITGVLTDRFYLGEDVEGAEDNKSTLTLALEDGRRFEFKVLEPGTNEIIGLNWLHD